MCDCALYMLRYIELVSKLAPPQWDQRVGGSTRRWAAQQRHARAVGLCRKVQTSYVDLRDAKRLDWDNKGLAADDMATLAMILTKASKAKTQT